MRELVGVAHAHLRNALSFTLLIPREETGIRRFCLWAIGLAVLTLRRIQPTPGFTSGAQVKVSHSAVAMTRVLTNMAVRNDWPLRRLFERAASGLPLASPHGVAPRAPSPARGCPGGRIHARGPPPAHGGQRPPVRRTITPLSGNVRAVGAGASQPANASGAALARARTVQRSALVGSHAIAAARQALIGLQSEHGYWVFELEADCTIPAEYILMMHFLDEIDPALQAKIAVYLRAHQAQHGGWPLYYNGELDISCSVKAYFALKLAGDSPEAAAHGAGAHGNSRARRRGARQRVHAHRAGIVRPGAVARACPISRSKSCCCRAGFRSISTRCPTGRARSWCRCSSCARSTARARNPRDGADRELFTTPPEQERNYFQLPPDRAGLLARTLPVASIVCARRIDPLIPQFVRRRALRRAEDWVLERLNGEDGLGAIFPAMVNALEAMVVRGYAADDPRRVTAKRALQKLLVVRELHGLLPAVRVTGVGHGAWPPWRMQEAGGAGGQCGRRARARLAAVAAIARPAG